MKRIILGLGVAVLLATAGLGTAGAVNCKQVNKYLDTGRSVSDIAETMVISEDDVKKCQAEKAAAPAGTPPASGTKTTPPAAEEKK
jgi:hypothetical protein